MASGRPSVYYINKFEIPFYCAILTKNYFQALTSDCEARKPHIDDVIKMGVDMHEHPAAGTINAYLTALNDQWSLTENLGHCLDQHIGDLKRQEMVSNLCLSVCLSAYC